MHEWAHVVVTSGKRVYLNGVLPLPLPLSLTLTLPLPLSLTLTLPLPLPLYLPLPLTRRAPVDIRPDPERRLRHPAQRRRAVRREQRPGDCVRALVLTLALTPTLTLTPTPTLTLTRVPVLRRRSARTADALERRRHPCQRHRRLCERVDTGADRAARRRELLLPAGEPDGPMG